MWKIVVHLKLKKHKKLYVCLYKHLFVHGVLHLRELDGSLYLVDWNIVNQRICNA